MVPRDPNSKAGLQWVKHQIKHMVKTAPTTKRMWSKGGRDIKVIEGGKKGVQPSFPGSQDSDFGVNFPSHESLLRTQLLVFPAPISKTLMTGFPTPTSHFAETSSYSSWHTIVDRNLLDETKSVHAVLFMQVWHTWKIKGAILLSATRMQQP